MLLQIAFTYCCLSLATQVLCSLDKIESFSNLNKNEQFVCQYSHDKLIIKYGYNADEVKACLNAHQTAHLLELTDSQLEGIPPYIDILTELVHINISFNGLKTANFNSIPNVCKQIRVVILDFNDIVQLRRGDFDCLTSLQKLSIANNTLTVIENGTFSERMTNIDHISLIHNNLTTLDSSLISRLKLSDNISITINASWNNVALITNSINLSIQDVTVSTRIGISLLHNNISKIDIQYYRTLFNITNIIDLYKLWNSGFDVRFNPLICDCDMYPLAKELAVFYIMDPDNPLFSITCNTPSSLFGKMVREVPDNQFNCSVTTGCPGSCSCINTVALNLTTVNCGSEYNNPDLPITVPKSDYLELYMRSSKIERISVRDYLVNTSVLDVSGCSISDIQQSLVPLLNSINTIKLDNNNLQYIPNTFQFFNFTKDQLLTLYGNPFNCDCHNLWMKAWILKNKQHLGYFDKIMCGKGTGAGTSVIEVQDEKFVCGNKGISWTLILAITGGIMLAILLVVSVVLVNKTRIELFLISHFGILKGARSSFDYDVFIPHSCEDDEIVHAIVDKLENSNPPLKVCLGERDFRLGKYITENILNAIETSHTSLLIVSNSFLRSSWCNMEFREAHMRFLKDRTINMTLVLLEELDEKLVYKELELYMKSHVYIRYSDSHFWTKVVDSLRYQPCSETSPLIST